MEKLLKKFTIWQLKRLENHKQDEYFIDMFGRMISQIEAVREAGEYLPGRDARYLASIDKLTRSLAAFALNKPLTPTVESRRSLMITEQELQEIEKILDGISPFPWRCEKSVPGEWWITSPDDSDHQFRADYEPIFESSGTVPQFGIDGEFIARSPEIVRRLIDEVRRLHLS